MNFNIAFIEGQKGMNQGLSMGEGLKKISFKVRGVQRGKIYVSAGAAKAGKSTFTNYAFIIGPYLEYLNNIGTSREKEVEWIYYSLEMSRVDQEFEFVVFFIYHFFGVFEIELPPEITVDGETTIPFSSDYLKGLLQDDNGDVVLVNDTIKEYMISMYEEHIVRLFGEYDEDGILIEPGMITFITSPDNPTGIYYNLMDHAALHGKLIKTGKKGFERITGYVANNPNKFTIVVLDHIRKLVLERGFSEKQNMDKMSSYFVILRDLLGYTFVNIVHLNRSLNDLDRFKQFGDLLYPNSDMIMSTGNLVQDANYVFTIMDPNDDRYNLIKHFGLKIKDNNRNQLYPWLRSIHLVESRHIKCPVHFRVNMNGGLKAFMEFIA